VLVDHARTRAHADLATTVAHLARTRPLPLVNVVMDATTFEQALRRRCGLPAPPEAPATGRPVQCELLEGTVLAPAQAIGAALAGHVRRVVYATPDLITGLSPRRPDGTLAHHRSDGTPITGPPRTHGGPGG
jgi:hypothetical protein